MKTLLRFRIEIFISILFLTLAILSIIDIGFSGVKESIFTMVAIIEVPVSYFGFRSARQLLINAFEGNIEYED